MKRTALIALLIISLISIVTAGWLRSPRARAMDGRGERQFNFSGPSSSMYTGTRPDRDPPNASRLDPDERDFDAYRGPADTDTYPTQSPRQQAGTAARTLRSNMGDDNLDHSRADAESELREGRFPGQMSNVPGTTSTSPNGTSNIYGTGGFPLLPQANERR